MPQRWRSAWLCAVLATGMVVLSAALPTSAQAQAAVAAQVNLAYQNIQQLIAERRYDAAIAAADRYLADNRRDPQVRFLKGVAQTGSGNTDAAIATFTELVQVYPELPEPYNNLAAIYAGRGDFDKARELLQQAVQANPAYAVAHENLGDIYIQLAAREYQQAQSLDARNSRLAPKLRLTSQLLAPQ
jgi:Flp pilus assembly protein TadD